MKKVILILFFLPLFTIAQQKTYVPDDNFENHLESNGMGDGIPSNDSVYTSLISGMINLNCQSSFISDMTGIEDFTSLENLACGYNTITDTLDLTNNINLTHLHAYGNQSNY